MKTFYSLMAAFALTCCATEEKEKTISEFLAGGRWIDLTYDFSSKTLYWPNNPEGFRLDTQFNGTTAGGFYYASNDFHAPEHGGTHLDAPVHFAEGKWSADQIPLSSLTGYVVIIDVQEKKAGNPDYLITTEDVLAWEKINGKVADDAMIFFRTGWGKFYPDAAKYLGTAAKGETATSDLHFPGIHPDLAEWLVKNRKIKAVGIDAASVDYGQSKDFRTHQILYKENIPGFENLANLDSLPAKGAYVVALPMKIKDGSGGPLRVIAWVK